MTQLLVAWCDGDQSALERLVPLVYAELRRVARRRMRLERSGHILQTTALIHEAYVRLIDVHRVRWQNRIHFFAVAAKLMRQVLVDAVRTRGARKRGGDISHVEFDEGRVPAPERAGDLVALDAALDALSKLDARKGRVVELRYFGGLSVEETAEVLHVSEQTVTRDWRMARLWLGREMRRAGGAVPGGGTVTVDRWADVERLCHAALERAPAARGAFLEAACAGDRDLRREVEELLAGQSAGDALLATPALEVAAQALAEGGPASWASGRGGAPESLRREPLARGVRLGPYEIEACIGAGGMGEVYRARDTRLGRTVAVKVLPAGFAADADRVRRFEQEARAASALNHPHICAVHDVGAAVPSGAAGGGPAQSGEGGPGVPLHFLVMEHLEGETLAARIARGPIPIGDVLEVGAQIADALSAAHRCGVTHRDLTPGNVMLTRRGTHRAGAHDIKLLDFGLAKLRPAGGAAVTTGGAASRSSVTAPGQIVGTLPYMAPEQLEGKATDARADLWALGAMLHEMVTGARAFHGATSAGLVAAILEREPAALSSLRPLAPAALDRLIRKCLAKDPDERWQSARDVADELRWVRETDGAGTAAAGRPRRHGRRIVLLLAGGLTMAGVGAGLTWLLRPAPTFPAGLSVDIQPADEVNAGGATSQGMPTPGGANTAVAWTPDGQALIFVGRRAGVQQLYLRRLDDAEARPIANTEGAQVPAVSADGRWVAFWAGASIRKVRLAGGPAEDLVPGVPNPPRGMAWSDIGDLFYGQPPMTPQEIRRVRAQGGAPEAVTKAVDQSGHRMPWPLPGGRALLYTVRKRVWTWGDEDVVAQRLDGGPPQVVLTDAVDARYVPTGHLVFLRRGTLWAVPFDADRLVVRGPPVSVLGGVAQSLSAWHSYDINGAGQFAVSSAGTLAWLRSSMYRLPAWRPVAVDRAGRATPLPLSSQVSAESDFWMVRASPDGRQLALGLSTMGGREIWVYDIERGSLRPVLRDGEALWFAWSPDNRLFIGWLKNGRHALATLPADADGTVTPQILESGPRFTFPAAFAPDGRVIGVRDDRELVTVTVENGKARVEPLHQATQAEAWPALSPDGRWLAYGAGQSDPMSVMGETEVYVRPFPGPGQARPVSVGGGVAPMWNPRGGELFYTRPRSKSHRMATVMVVDLGPGNPARLGTPRPLFDYDGDELCFGSMPLPCHSVAPDGQHFYTTGGAKPSPPPPVTHIDIIPNWFAELKARVPVR